MIIIVIKSKETRVITYTHIRVTIDLFAYVSLFVNVDSTVFSNTEVFFLIPYSVQFFEKYHTTQLSECIKHIVVALSWSMTSLFNHSVGWSWEVQVSCHQSDTEHCLYQCANDNDGVLRRYLAWRLLWLRRYTGLVHCCVAVYCDSTHWGNMLLLFSQVIC